jgi:flagellar motility protein MotE (MotC chaperone)
MPTGDASEPLRLANQLQNELAQIAKREQEFERQQELYQIVIEDLRDEMESLQGQLKKTPADKKPVEGTNKSGANRPAAPASASAEKAPKKAASADASDPALQNLRLATGITESMQPEAAARTIEQLAKSGKSDIAVQLLAKLSPRQSAKILALISDEKLSTQLFEGLLAAKVRPAPPPP